MAEVKRAPSYPDPTPDQQAPIGETLAGPVQRLLIVDDDEKFRARLAQSMALRGFAVQVAGDVDEALAIIEARPPALALIDIRLGNGGNGLDIIAALHTARPDATLIVLTGYGSIANAVAAVKAGAVGYLSKLTDADEIAAALHDPDSLDRPPIPGKPMSDTRVRWEYLNRLYELCDRNLSKTARRLHTHRRSLQRFLKRRAPN